MDPFKEDEVSAQKLKDLFSNAFLSATIDNDGDVRVEEDGVKVFLRVNGEKKVVTYFAVWGMKPGNDNKKPLFVNKLNNEYRMVRFRTPSPEQLWCDYEMPYAGGLIPAQVVNTYKVFTTICKAAAANDPDNLVK